MNKLKKCKLFHNWIVVKKKGVGTFLGVSYDRSEHTTYEVCTKCGLARDAIYDSQGGSVWMLSDTQTEILWNKIEDGREYFIETKEN